MSQKETIGESSTLLADDERKQILPFDHPAYDADYPSGPTDGPNDLDGHSCNDDSSDDEPPRYEADQPVDALQIEVERIHSGAVVLSVRIDDVEVYRDRFNPDSAAQRRRFQRAVLNKLPVGHFVPETGFDAWLLAAVNDANAPDDMTLSAIDNPVAWMASHFADDELFRDGDGRSFASYAVDDENAGATHVETWPIHSDEFAGRLKDRYYTATGQLPTKGDIRDARELLSFRAGKNGIVHDVRVRVARGPDNAVYLFMANPGWQAIRITANGIDVVDNPPVKFVRTSGVRELPVPDLAGSIDDLRQLVHAKDDSDFQLLGAAIFATFCPEGPYPITFLHGGHGAGKTTAAWLMASIVDSRDSSPQGLPANKRDLFVDAANRHVVTYDNLSKLNEDTSDALCRMSQGESHVQRKLYTDSDQFKLTVTRPFVLTSIEQISERGDLLDRAIMPELAPVRDEQRLPQNEFEKKFAELHPKLLGAFCKAVQANLRREPMLEFERLPRMARFAQWVAAGCEAFGWDAEDFLQNYERNRHDAARAALEGMPLATALQRLSEELAASGTREWRGTATHLGKMLRDLASRAGEVPSNIPTNPSTLSAELNRIGPNLHLLALQLEHQRSPDNERKRLIILRPTTDAGDRVQRKPYLRLAHECASDN